MTIGEAWAFLDAQITADGAKAIQLREMRKMFYCGCAWMFARVVMASDGSEQDGSDQLSALYAEIQHFQQENF